MIAENMLCRVDSNSFLITLLEVITDYAKDNTALNNTHKYMITPREDECYIKLLKYGN